MQTAPQATFQNLVVNRQVSKCWVLRIKIPNWTIPIWVITTIKVLGFLIFYGLVNGIIGQ